jgi:UPF0755 protein
MLRKLFVLALVGVIALALGGWWAHRRLNRPFAGYAGTEVVVDLPPGSSVSAIATRLADAGIVPDSWTFRLAARIAGADRRLQAGEYRFTGAASPVDVVGRLERGDVIRRAVTFPEGLTIVEMGAILERAGLGTAREFERAARDPSALAQLDPDAASLEGYLFPDTYTFARRAGADAVVDAMVAGFVRAFDADVRARAAARGLSVREVVTLASLIEKETARADERAVVSAVYHNRLARRMPLQCDPTVIYAMMQAGIWRGNIQRVHLQIDSPYNTYRFAGLPPGPIASPGRAALEAAVSPADVPYLYFVSRNDGSHVFAETLAEHNRNVTRWQRRGRQQP